MEGKGSFFILIVIVALLTLTLAVLAGYLLLGGSPAKVQQVSQLQNPLSSSVPSDDKLEKKLLFEDKKFFNLKNEDSSTRISVINVNVELVYFKNVKGIKNVKAKIDAYDNKIKEVIGTYFQGLTLSDVEKPDAKEKAKEELKTKLNEVLLASEKEKSNPIIYTINFPEWFYQ